MILSKTIFFKLRHFFLQTALFSIILMLCSCNNDSNTLLDEDPLLSEKLNRPIYGGELKLIEVETYRNLLPSAIQETFGYRIVSQIHNSLLKMNPKSLNVEPSIASKWEVNDEQTKYTFYLRNNIYFHDDSCFVNKEKAKLTTEDIVFTFELLCGELYNGGYNLLLNNLLGANEFYNKTKPNIEGLKVLNDTTITFELINPAPSFIHLLASTKASIISKVAYEKYESSITIGCGPFQFSGLSNDSNFVYLTKNNSYFLKDRLGNSLPYLDSVTFRINTLQKDPTNFFLEKDIMILYDLPENKVEELFANHHEKFENKEFILDRKSVLGTDCYELNTSKPPFDDVNVRKAFSYAINRKSILENILKNQGKAGKKGIVPIVETFKYYNYDTVANYYHDPLKAKELLAKAGYPNGEKFPEVILELTGGQSVKLEAAKEVQTQLQNILNVRITIEQTSLSQLINRAAYGKTQMSHFTWLSEYPSPIDFLNLFYGAENPDNLNSYIWPNISRFNNKSYDKTLEKAMVTSDFKERFNLYAKAEAILMEQAPLIVLWYPESYNVVHGCVKNLHFNEMLHFDYSKVYIQ
jgi:peptide/nickel transport system substrate-binding protein